jgi:hypothetical protein
MLHAWNVTDIPLPNIRTPLMPADQLAAWTSSSREDAERYASDRTDVLRLRSLLPLDRFEFDLLVLIQRPVAGTRDRGEVDEHVHRPVIGAMKPKPLSALNHFTVPVAISL